MDPRSSPLHGWMAIVLAAGQGTRMQSSHAKVSHRIAGRSLIGHVLAAVAEAGVPSSLVVLGHRADEVLPLLAPGTGTCYQHEQLGTGHAVQQAREQAFEAKHLLILYADMPLLRPTTLRTLVDGYLASRADLALLTGILDDPTGYGRLVRRPGGEIAAVVEEKEATSRQRSLKEINCGVYCCRGAWLWPRLERLQRGDGGEYYLTDLVGMAVAEGAVITSHTTSDTSEGQGINDRAQLAQAEALMRERIRQRWLQAGVTMIDPATCYIDGDVAIGRDTIIYPNTFIEGQSTIGSDCVIGPNTQLIDSSIGDRTRVWASYLEGASVGSRTTVGPLAHLRPGASVGDEAEIGNYAEIKTSRLGHRVKMHHFSYLGDAEVGSDVNIGAGTITCNFDGESGTKSRTVIQDEASLGSDTLLVAPLSVGRRAITGAGSVVTRDIPDETVVYGVPARLARKRREQVQ